MWGSLRSNTWKRPETGPARAPVARGGPIAEDQRRHFRREHSETAWSALRIAIFWTRPATPPGAALHLPETKTRAPRPPPRPRAASISFRIWPAGTMWLQPPRPKPPPPGGLSGYFPCGAPRSGAAFRGPPGPRLPRRRRPRAPRGSAAGLQRPDAFPRRRMPHQTRRRVFPAWPPGARPGTRRVFPARASPPARPGTHTAGTPLFARVASGMRILCVRGGGGI